MKKMLAVTMAVLGLGMAMAGVGAKPAGAESEAAARVRATGVQLIAAAQQKDWKAVAALVDGSVRVRDRADIVAWVRDHNWKGAKVESVHSGPEPGCYWVEFDLPKDLASMYCSGRTGKIRGYADED